MLPIDKFEDNMFINDVGFDGSSIRGFQLIHESDMLIRPFSDTMFIDLFMDDPVDPFLCNINDSIANKIHSRDTRAVAVRVELFLEANQIVDSAFFGLELEFFLFLIYQG